MRGEWIEMAATPTAVEARASLPMRGEWIEIGNHSTNFYPSRLSPCGESGLKYVDMVGRQLADQSLPMRGEWIEIK